MVFKEFLAAQFFASASVRSKVSRAAAIQVSGLLGVSCTYGFTFFFTWGFAARILVLFLYCWSSYYEFGFSCSAVVFVLSCSSLANGGLCALVTCLSSRLFFGCPRRDCRVSIGIYT